MASTSPGSGVSLPKSPQIPHMPGSQGYAVASCHVERPLDDRVWQRYSALARRRPGGARPTRLDPPRRRPARARAPDDSLARRRDEGALPPAAARRPRPLPRLRAGRADAPRGDRGDAEAARPAAAPGLARRARCGARGFLVGRMRRLIGGAVLACVLLAACGSGNAQHGVSVRVDTNPFRLTLLREGKPLVAEDKGARLRYQLRSTGDQFTLTKVLSSSGGVYQVATSEPGRTATVVVRRAPGTVRLALRLHPETNVQQVYDAFDTSSSDHFLGGGERTDGVDLRGRILPVKVSNVCSYAPVPYFASSAGWAVRLATQNVSALAFPDSAGGGGCRFGDESQCGFPPLDERGEVGVRGARLDEDRYAGDFAHTLALYERDAGRRAVPPPSELALIKWRGAYEGPAPVLADIARPRAAT